MASVVEICNRALQHLGESGIASLSETNKKARECNTAYEPTRDAMLRKYRWNFAITRAELAADVTGPIGDDAPDNYFTLPSDFLRLLPPNDARLDWAIEGRKIATSYSAPLYIRYIYKVTDPNEMDAAFREALSLQMAKEMCYAITGSNSKQAQLSDDLKIVVAEAKKANAIEQVSDEMPEDDWITVRNNGRWPQNTVG